MTINYLSQISDKQPKALPPSQEEARAKSWWQDCNEFIYSLVLDEVNISMSIFYALL
jgi:hypothetical protein